jgi:hypothetical protein
VNPGNIGIRDANIRVAPADPVTATLQRNHQACGGSGVHQQRQGRRTAFAYGVVSHLRIGAVDQHGSGYERCRADGKTAEWKPIDCQFSRSEFGRDGSLDDGAWGAIANVQGQFDGVALP